MSIEAGEESAWLSLIEAAVAAQQQAYAPYSDFPVGAAILDEAGETHLGCNVENSSYGLCICAERNAATTMISSGARRIVRVAIASPGGVAPCGACRQFMSEFGMEFEIALFCSRRQKLQSVVGISQLLPYAFGPNDLNFQ